MLSEDDFELILGRFFILGERHRQAAHAIFEAAEQDRNDALAAQDAAWHEIEEGHLVRIAELEAENERLLNERDDYLKAWEGLERIPREDR